MAQNALFEAINDPRRTIGLLQRGGSVHIAASQTPLEDCQAVLAAIYPEWLGDRAFTSAHGSRFAYVVGEMARGIATPDMVTSAVRAGFCGFFGSAGLDIQSVGDALRRIRSRLGPQAPAWGANLIHSPQAPEEERAVVDVFLDHDVQRVSASAFMRLSPEIVRYAASGLARDRAGEIRRRTHVFAKVSRSEVARHFMSPPPADILRKLVGDGAISEAQAELAARLPVACDITAEADSGGHTDNRAATVLLPELITLRSEIADEHGFSPDCIRIGLAGGLATPASLAAAYTMGAAYVLTGSINQAARESGLSADARAMLAEAASSDVAMAPAADMFEQGVEVQVLSRGTLFAARGRRLRDIYRHRDSLDDCTEKERQFIETALGESIDDAWSATAAYLARQRPKDLERARRDPRHRMALLMRRYLFNGAHWAREGDTKRRADYQIWCGPAMGGFNDWVRGSPLEPVEARGVAEIGWALLDGAARVMRAAQLRTAGVAVPPSAFDIRPRKLTAAQMSEVA